MRKKVRIPIPIVIPQEIREMANRFREERLEKERHKKQREKEAKACKAKIREKRLLNGFCVAKEIVFWALCVKRSKAGQELLKKSRDGIFFFDGHAGTLEWVGFTISGRGILELVYSTGHSPVGSIRKRIASPGHLAIAVDTKILKDVVQWIIDGRAWECIKRRLNQQEKKPT